MIMKISLFVLMFIIISCESAFVDTLGKCSIKDSECQKELYEKSVKEISGTGIPENGIPPFDPFHVQNVSVNVFDLIEIGMEDGVTKGIRGCVFEKVNTTIDTLHSTMTIFCKSITIKGIYKVKTLGTFLKNLLGGNIQGHGKSRVVVENLRINFDMDFFVRETDGEIYIGCKKEDIKLTYEIGNIKLSAENLSIGNLDTSSLLVNLFNDNWKSIMDMAGAPFMKTAIDFVYIYNKKFFDATPAKLYITDDLTPFL